LRKSRDTSQGKNLGHFPYFSSEKYGKCPGFSVCVAGVSGIPARGDVLIIKGAWEGVKAGERKTGETPRKTWDTDGRTGAHTEKPGTLMEEQERTRKNLGH
jgi:hypothetical protein